MTNPLKQITIITRHGAPIWYSKTGHKGLDLRAEIGTPIYAVTSGRFDSSWGVQGGLWGVLWGEDGAKYRYGHLSSVTASGRVREGQEIGRTGNSGIPPLKPKGSKYSPHLHFDAYHNGWLDPENFITKIKKIMFGRLYSSRGVGESPFEINGRRPCLEFDGKRHGFVSEAIFNKFYGPEFELQDAPKDAGNKSWGERIKL